MVTGELNKLKLINFERFFDHKFNGNFDFDHLSSISEVLIIFHVRHFPMDKNFENQHSTVAFFMRSVPILTPTGVNKRQFLKLYMILLYNRCKIVVFTPVVYQYRYPTGVHGIKMSLYHVR